jgi:hypothetical protein
MNVNWRNLGKAIEQGKIAYKRGSENTYNANIIGVSTNDYSQMDLVRSVIDNNIKLGNRFSIGKSLWGRNERIR